MILAAILAVAVAAGCVAKTQVVEGQSELLPGVVYTGFYVKHAPGMNFGRVDMHKGDKVYAGNTVNNDGVVNKAVAGFVGNAPIGAGLGAMYLGRRPDTTSVSTSSNTKVSGGNAMGFGAGGGAVSSSGAVSNAGAISNSAAAAAANAEASGGFVPPGQQP